MKCEDELVQRNQCICYQVASASSLLSDLRTFLHGELDAHSLLVLLLLLLEVGLLLLGHGHAKVVEERRLGRGGHHGLHLALVLAGLGLLLLDGFGDGQVLAGLPVDVGAAALGQRGCLVVQQVGADLVLLGESLNNKQNTNTINSSTDHPGTMELSSKLQQQLSLVQTSGKIPCW